MIPAIYDYGFRVQAREVSHFTIRYFAELTYSIRALEYPRLIPRSGSKYLYKVSYSTSEAFDNIIIRFRLSVGRNILAGS